MREEHFSSLRSAISQERLSPYCHSEDEDDLCAFARYAWNMALSESLYPTLQGLEITLRNSVHKAATDAFGTDFWFDSETGILKNLEQKKVKGAKEKLERENKSITSGRIVAELNFGFWTSLFNSRYEQVLWPKMLKATFPKVPRRRRNRKYLLNRLDRIRHLRNRVFHYEPIWHWKDLSQQHDELLKAVGWISPALRRTLAVMDRFPEVYEQGYEPYRSRLLSLMNETERDSTPQSPTPIIPVANPSYSADYPILPEGSVAIYYNGGR